jgi:hypothetical protein
VYYDRARDEGAAGSSTVVAAPEAPPELANPRPPTTHKPERGAGPRKPAPNESKLDAFEAKTEAAPPSDPVANAPTGGAKMELAIGGEEADMAPKGSPDATATQSTDGPTKPGTTRAPVTRQPLPPIEGEDRAGKDKASIAALVKQCEAAAAKNDCPAVRVIAQKIEKQDPVLYKQKVAKNATIARCLNEGTIQTLE